MGLFRFGFSLVSEKITPWPMLKNHYNLCRPLVARKTQQQLHTAREEMACSRLMADLWKRLNQKPCNTNYKSLFFYLERIDSLMLTLGFVLKVVAILPKFMPSVKLYRNRS